MVNIELLLAVITLHAVAGGFALLFTGLNLAIDGKSPAWLFLAGIATSATALTLMFWLGAQA